MTRRSAQRQLGSPGALFCTKWVMTITISLAARTSVLPLSEGGHAPEKPALNEKSGDTAPFCCLQLTHAAAMVGVGGGGRVQCPVQVFDFTTADEQSLTSDCSNPKVSIVHFDQVCQPSHCASH